MRKVYFILLVFAFVMTNLLSFANDNKIVLGTWKVEVADAPYEYVKSSLIVSEENGALAAIVKFEDGQELKVSGIQFSKDVITLIVTVDGSDMKVSGKVENSKITGKVEAPDGVLELTATKIP